MHIIPGAGGAANLGGDPQTFSDPGGLFTAHSPGPRPHLQSLATPRNRAWKKPPIPLICLSPQCPLIDLRYRWKSRFHR
jgi:hypothetical protein